MRSLFPSRRHFMLSSILCLSMILATDPKVANASDPPPAPLPAFWTMPGKSAKPILLQQLKGGEVSAGTIRRELGMIADQEDNDAAEFGYLSSLYAGAPDPYYALLYWSFTATTASNLGNENAIAAAARHVLASGGQTPLMRAFAQDSLAYALDDAGKSAAADVAWGAQKYIRKWQVIGPFDNASLSGFERGYDPEKGIDYSKASTGSDDQEVHWHPLSVVDRDGYAEVGSALEHDGANVFYASTAIDSPTDGLKAALKFSTIGASKIFVNGVLVVRDPVYREQESWSTDTMTATVTLRKGWNTLLVKVADNENVTSAFRMRLTDLADRPLDFVVQPAEADHAVAVSEPTPIAPMVPTLITIVKQHIAAHPDDIESRYFLGELLWSDGDYTDSIAALREGIERAPKSALLHWQLSLSLAKDEQKDAAREQREIARGLDNRIAAAELEAVSEDKDSKKGSEQISHLKQLLAGINPHSSTLLWALADADSAGDMAADAFATAQLAADASPTDSSYDRLYSWYNDRKKPALAAKALKEGSRRFPFSSDLGLDRAQDFANNDNSASAIAEYRKLLGANHPLTKYRTALADLYKDAKKYPDAIAQLKQARLEQPQNAQICADLGDLHRETGNKADAIALYREAIRLDPGQIILRDKLQTLTGETPASQIVAATDTTAIFKKLPKAADYPGASEVRLLDEGRQILYPDFAQVTYYHVIITLLDDAAIKSYQRFYFTRPSGYSTAIVETARIVKPDHKIVDCRDNGDRYSAAFPSLTPGDTIDLIYRVEDYPHGGLAGKFWSAWTYPQLNGPVKLSRFVLITPKDVNLGIKVHNGAAEPVTRVSGPWQIREWRQADLPALKPELLSADDSLSGMWIDISTVQSWQEIVDWYQTLSRPRCVADATVRAKALELTKDAKTEDDKIRAIVEFVARKIEYQTSPFRLSAFVPTEGKNVLRDSYGDCKDKAALVTAMLGSVGITSHMALLSPRSDGTTAYLPSPRFSHAIAVVDTAKGPLWVDATADTMEFGPAPAPDQNVPALLIKDGVTDLTTTPTPAIERSTFTETATVALDAAGGLAGTESLSFTGDIGGGLRSAVRSIPQASRELGLNSIFTQLLPNGKVTNASLTGLDDPDQTLGMKCDFKIAEFGQVIDGLIIARVPWAQGLAQGDPYTALRTTTAPRRSPMELAGGRGRVISSVDLQIPAGYKIKDLKPEAAATFPFASYKFTYTVAGSILHAYYEIDTFALSVEPKDIPAYLDFTDIVRKQAKAPLVFEKI